MSEPTNVAMIANGPARVVVRLQRRTHQRGVSLVLTLDAGPVNGTELRMHELTQAAFIAEGDSLLRRLSDLPGLETIALPRPEAMCQDQAPRMLAACQRFDGPFRYADRRIEPPPACCSRRFIVVIPTDRMMRVLTATCDGCNKAWTLDLVEGLDGGDRDPWRAVVLGEEVRP